MKLLVAIAFAFAFASVVSPEHLWEALGKSELAAGNACESYYYRAKLLDEAGTEGAAYYAFQSAYAADLDETAYVLLARIQSDNLRALVQQQAAELAQRKAGGGLHDAVCTPHRARCGDAIVDAGEQCDDGNAVSHDGCSDRCVVDAPAERRVPEGYAPPPPPDPPKERETNTDVLLTGAAVACGAAVLTCAGIACLGSFFAPGRH